MILLLRNDFVRETPQMTENNKMFINLQFYYDICYSNERKQSFSLITRVTAMQKKSNGISLKKYSRIAINDGK